MVLERSCRCRVVRVFVNDGAGNFTNTASLLSCPGSLGIAGVNHDGIPAIVTTGVSADRNPCFVITLISLRPFERAVRM